MVSASSGEASKEKNLENNFASMMSQAMHWGAEHSDSPLAKVTEEFFKEEEPKVTGGDNNEKRMMSRNCISTAWKIQIVEFPSPRYLPL